jgi:biopolymer transport protein ExbD
MNKPNINVTPLIDVLLVLLIIFMVVVPLKPAGFRARIPTETRDPSAVVPNPNTLVVIVDPDSSLKLNAETGLGSCADPSALVGRLAGVFDQRITAGDLSESFADDPDRRVGDRIERTVFIKAPRAIDYGNVARVVDAVKLAGAFPISLQIDDLQ